MLNYRPSERLRRRLQDLVLVNAPRNSAQSLVNYLWAYASLGLPLERTTTITLIERILDAEEALPAGTPRNPQHVSNTTWALALLQCHPGEELLARLEAQIMATAPLFLESNYLQLCQVLLYFDGSDGQRPFLIDPAVDALAREKWRAVAYNYTISQFHLDVRAPPPRAASPFFPHGLHAPRRAVPVSIRSSVLVISRCPRRSLLALLLSPWAALVP